MIIQWSKWIGTPLATRVKIAQQFGISKVRSTSVINNVVVDDGYDVHAVENALNLAALQIYLETKEKDMNVLFQMLVDKMEGRVAVLEVVTPSPTKSVLEVIDKIVPKKKVVTKKKK